MNFIKKNIFTLAIAMLIITMVSCDNNFNKIRKINSVRFFPTAEVENLNLKYVDSGRVKAILVSPRMDDYSSVKYPFTEFKKGIHLTVMDQNKNENFVESDYAINYSKQELIDLRGNVVITTHDGKKLETEQLYYDQKNDWFFTEKHYKITTEDNSFTEGDGIDFDSKFETFTTKNSYAEQPKSKL